MLRTNIHSPTLWSAKDTMKETVKDFTLVAKVMILCSVLLNLRQAGCQFRDFLRKFRESMDTEQHFEGPSHFRLAPD